MKVVNVYDLISLSELTLARLCFQASQGVDKVSRSPFPSAVRSPSCQHDSPEAQDVCRSVHQFWASLKVFSCVNNLSIKYKSTVTVSPSTIDFILFGDSKYAIKFFKSDE